MSLISRKLLTPDEVLKIESPYILVMIAGKPPALLNVPDISKMYFNKLNGMGTKEENQRLRIERENARKVRKISKSKIWNIWDKVKNNESDLDEKGNSIISPYEITHDIFLNEEEKLEIDLGTGPQCLR